MRFRVISDFPGDGSNELPLHAGEVILLLDSTELPNGWLRGIKNDGQTGIFPEIFVEPIDSDEQLPPHKRVRDFSRIKSINNPAITLQNFIGETESELSFSSNQMVMVEYELEDGWSEGFILGDRLRKGRFPSNFVKIIGDCPNPPSPIAQRRSHLRSSGGLNPSQRIPLDLSDYANGLRSNIVGNTNLNNDTNVTFIPLPPEEEQSLPPSQSISTSHSGRNSNPYLISPPSTFSQSPFSNSSQCSPLTNSYTNVNPYSNQHLSPRGNYYTAHSGSPFDQSKNFFSNSCSYSPIGSENGNNDNYSHQYHSNFANYQQKRSLRPGWERLFTETGREFFVDHNTRSTHWNYPYDD